MNEHDDRLRELGTQLPYDQPDPARRDAVRSALLVAAGEGDARRPAARWYIVGGAFAAGALAAAAALLLVVRHDSKVTLAPSAARIDASPAAQFDRQVTRTPTGTDEVVRVHTGTLNVAVGALRAGDHVRVATRDAEVEGEGAYAVAVVGDQLKDVTVADGHATIRITGEQAVFLSSGQSWHASGGIVARADMSSVPSPSGEPPAAQIGAASGSTGQSPPAVASEAAGQSALAAASEATGQSPSAAASASEATGQSPSTAASEATGQSPSAAAVSEHAGPSASAGVRSSASSASGAAVSEHAGPSASAGVRSSASGAAVSGHAGPSASAGVRGSGSGAAVSEHAGPLASAGVRSSASGVGVSEHAGPSASAGVRSGAAQSRESVRPASAADEPAAASVATSPQPAAPESAASHAVASEPARPAPPPPAAAKEVETRFQTGMSLLKTGKAAEAARELIAAADAGGDDPLAADARYFAAVALTKAGRKTEAEQQLIAFLDHAPHSIRRGRAAVMLGRLIAERGDAKSARAWFESALIDPDASVVAAARAGIAALK